jgi:hypothetical protein
MSYQTTVNILRDTANAVNSTGRFIHGRKIDASGAYNGMYPIIFCYPFNVTKGIDPNFIDRSDILLGFYMEDKPDSSPEEREAIIAQMDELSDAFVYSLGESAISRISNVVKEPMYQIYSGDLSGYAIRFTFEDFTPCEEE